MIKQTIYLELNAILDTRLGTMETLVPNCALKLIKKGYFERKHDRFWETIKTITEDEYVKTYTSADRKVLANSYITRMIEVIASVKEEVDKESLGNNSLKPVDLVLNSYPFEFSKEEKDTLAVAFSHHLGEDLDFRIVSVSPMLTTPDYLKSEYSIIVMYDFMKWFRLHEEKLLKTSMPDVVFFIPELVEKETKDVEEAVKKGELPKEAMALANVDYFTGLSLTLAGHVNLQSFEIGYFCTGTKD